MSQERKRDNRVPNIVKMRAPSNELFAFLLNIRLKVPFPIIGNIIKPMIKAIMAPIKAPIVTSSTDWPRTTASSKAACCIM